MHPNAELDDDEPEPPDGAFIETGSASPVPAAYTAANKASQAAKRAKQWRDDRKANLATTPAGEPTSGAELMASDVEDVLSGLPVNAQLKLYKIDDKTGAMAWCKTYGDPKMFAEGAVLEEFGPGSYRLMARRPNSQGKSVFVTSKSVHIAAPKVGTVAVDAPRAAGMQRDDQLWQMFLDGQRRADEMHKTMMTVMMNRPAADPTMELMKVLLPALLTNRADPMTMAVQLAELTKSKTDPMEMAVQIAALMKPAGGGTLTDQFALVEKLMELTGNGRNESDGGGPLEAFKIAAPLIQQALAAPKAQGALPPARRPDIPAPTPSTGPALPNAPASPPAVTAGVSAVSQEQAALSVAPVEDTRHPVHRWLDEWMPRLMAAASRADDPRDYVNPALNELPADQYQTLDAILRDPSGLIELANRYPTVAAHQAWFGRFVAEVQATLVPMDDEAPQAEARG